MADSKEPAVGHKTLYYLSTVEHKIKKVLNPLSV